MTCEKNIVMIRSTIICLWIKVVQEGIAVPHVLMKEGMKMELTVKKNWI